MKRFLALTALGMAGAMALTGAPAMAQLSIGVSVNFAPPAIPVYDQPPIPAPDYMWIPGYWAWDDDVQDYYWIPGTWVLAPRPGLLWTPPWWEWQGGFYRLHPGYWGPHVGFYGGVAYGFGYTGSGYEGAYWQGPHLFYNRSVTNITNVHVTNVYEKTVVVNRTPAVSYHGGPGGTRAQPSPAEQAAAREAHVAATPVQQQHLQAARANRQLFTSANHGRPPIAAAARPGQFGGAGVVPARQATDYHAPSAAGRDRPPAQPSDTGPQHAAPPVKPADAHDSQPKAQDVAREHQDHQDHRAAPSPARDNAHGQSSPEERPLEGQKVPDPSRSRDIAGDGGSHPGHAEDAPRPPANAHPPAARPASPPHPSHPPHPQGGGNHPHPQGGGHPKPPPPHKEDHRHD